MMFLLVVNLQKKCILVNFINIKINEKLKQVSKI